MLPQRFLRPLLVLVLLVVALSLALSSAGAGPVAPASRSLQSNSAATNAGVLQDCELAAPALVSPPNGAIVNPTNVTVDWDPVDGAEDYTLEGSEYPDMSNSASVTTADTQYTLVGTLRPDFCLYWHVRANKSGCPSGPWSETWYACTPPATPTATATESVEVTPTATATES
ncbi:MAG: hypothetical protein JXA74_16005, partial [Anaerolineae bacterium]|nr:hypothetical protein [Anaerolineae bacterium]